jgi:hypothetical protein
VFDGLFQWPQLVVQSLNRKRLKTSFCYGIQHANQFLDTVSLLAQDFFLNVVWM